MMWAWAMGGQGRQKGKGEGKDDGKARAWVLSVRYEVSSASDVHRSLKWGEGRKTYKEVKRVNKTHLFPKMHGRRRTED
jgi:hypothetical protein